MSYKVLTQHRPATLAEAKTLQQSLSSKVIFTAKLKPVEFVDNTAVDFAMGCITRYRLPKQPVGLVTGLSRPGFVWRSTALQKV